MKTPSYTASENQVLSHAGWAGSEGSPICVCTGSPKYANAMAEMIADALNRLEQVTLNQQAIAAKCARYALMAPSAKKLDRR